MTSSLKYLTIFLGAKKATPMRKRWPRLQRQEENMGEVRFGIIGAGMIARFHAEAIADTKGASLVSVCCPVDDQREEFAETYSIKAFRDLAPFLADPDLDAVTVAVPTGTHRDVAVPSARAGKHILCEKPLDITPRRAQDIIDACHNNHVILAPVFQHRYDVGARMIREGLDAGRFGELLFVSVRVKWFRDQSYYRSGVWRGTWEQDGGGCLISQAIHAIDLMIYFAGPPIEVFGNTALRTHLGITVEDNAAGTVKFANGALGTIEASTSCAPGWPFEIEVSGSRGTATLTGRNISRWEFSDDNPLDEKVRTTMLSASKEGRERMASVIDSSGHRTLIENMVKAITSGERAVIDGEEARYSLDLIHAFYESTRTRQPVRLYMHPA